LHRERRRHGVPSASTTRARCVARAPGSARQRVSRDRSARFEDLSYGEIAAALECSISSVESLIFRARQGLARALSGA
jgi:DNA-directed RNA polymerase specialized sigma24 family protein